MQVYPNACTVHSRPDVSEAKINDFLQLTFIDGRYVLKDGFRFSLC